MTFWGWIRIWIRGSMPLTNGSGSGFGSIPLTDGSVSESRRPKNMWIRLILIRIRIHNTGDTKGGYRYLFVSSSSSFSTLSISGSSSSGGCAMSEAAGESSGSSTFTTRLSLSSNLDCKYSFFKNILSFFVVYYFLIMSPILYFWEMSGWIRTQRAALASRIRIRGSVILN